ncbi:hypothetical protein KUTeg_003497 [Tegillarca granosa]|uniref:RRM domain-containing protein n=1 Tax=Tegillarca granosa TaxID=220873 RepID=A0ABQ9FNX3_TEGGR|nr:hypothetical protein KUTeg_003497 [Tegillarca granosa]
MKIFFFKMQSITRFIARVLPKRPTLLRPVNSTLGSAVNASRCICTCKIFHKYPKNEEKSNYVEVSNLPFETKLEDLKAYFEDAEFLEEPELISSIRGFQTGTAVLKVANPDLVVEKNATNFSGRDIRVRSVKEERALALNGKTVVKLTNLPFDWGVSDIYEFLYTQGVGKIMLMVVPPSLVFGSNCAGRAYVAFHNIEDKAEAVQLLTGVSAGRRMIQVEESNIVEGYLDRARARKRAAEMNDN